MEIIRDKIENAVTLSDQLRVLLVDYLESKPHLSLGAISKRCDVSEPTLRRIKNGQIKTLPTSSTVLNFLTYIFSTQDLHQIIEQSSGPLVDYLNEIVPQAQESPTHFNLSLNQELQDNLKYLVFKRASNRCGIGKNEIQRLFGEYGLSALADLERKGFIEFQDGKYYGSKEANFSLDPSQFIEKFKVAADYISNQQEPASGLLNGFHVNYSESISSESYKSIAQIQRRCFQKIRKIIKSQSSSGPIPFQYLCALDTLDTKAPYEF